MKKFVLGIVVCVVAAGPAAAEGPRAGDISRYLPAATVELDSLRAPHTVDRETVKRQRADLHAWLMAEQVVAGVERPLSVGISTKELMEMELGICEGCGEEPEGLRAGITREVRAELDFGGVSWGAVRRSPDGGRVWSAAVKSAGAFGLRLHFDNFELPPDAELYLFNESGAVAGPYTKAGPLGSGEFWSHMVRGEMVYLQLRQYGPDRAEKRGRRYFSLVDVGHVARGFGRSAQASKEFCSFNADCVVNVECQSSGAVVEARDAVAHMLYVKRPYIYMCSGGLLNNSNNDQTPYFLTANHCISRDREAGTLETYFQWSVPCGTSACEDPPFEAHTLGSSVVATNKTGDFTLLLLNGNAPSGSLFLGWNTVEVAFSDNTELYRVSHPMGAPQAYSEHTVDTAAGTCSSWPRGSWIYSRDTYGATQGGSSGSPVVDGQGKVVGQLSGACGMNINDDCDSDLNATVDGAFASYYSQVAQWLDPAGCVPVPEICDNGVDDDCDGMIDGADPDCQVCPPEVCDDGIDNDCDGLVDGADPDCTVCLPRGEPCSSGAECCSGSCHPRKLTCK